MSNKTISILGCGWLGFELATTLINRGYQVKGSVRNALHLDTIESAGIDSYLIDLQADQIIGDLSGFMQDTQLLLINIPPGLRRDPDSNFVRRIELLMQQVANTAIQQVIFISSTSVFRDQPHIPVYDTSSTPNAISNNGKQIYQAEQVVQSYHNNTTIIRPGGLIGGDRHPIKMLAGRININNPTAPINLVTRDYLIDLIYQVITGDLIASVIHAISEPHISRNRYYQSIADQWQLSAPQFNYHQPVIGKKIVS